MLHNKYPSPKQTNKQKLRLKAAAGPSGMRLNCPWSWGQFSSPWSRDLISSHREMPCVLGEKLRGCRHRGGVQRGTPRPGPAISRRLCAQRRAFQSQAACEARRRGEGLLSSHRLRIAQNWVMLTASSGHSLPPLTIISFLPDICPFKERAGRVQAHFYKMRTGSGVC